MDNFLIYEEIHKRDGCIIYRGRIKKTIDFVMIYCVDKYKRHELSNLVSNLKRKTIDPMDSFFHIFVFRFD